LDQVLRVPDHARPAAITMAAIMVVSKADPVINSIMNAARRFRESGIGAAGRGGGPGVAGAA